MIKKKGKRRRSNVKYPGLVKGVNSKLRHEYMDEDYIHKLNDEEKQWLSNFNEEYIGGNFYHKGEVLHKTVEEKRECYTRNNARNRDIQSIKKATGYLASYEGVGDMSSAIYKGKENIFEDMMIAILDKKSSKRQG